ncbi:MAG TPA: hypothetical protein PLK78_03730 [Verrucomicrobiota bacterium]|nr:hypothetical protein [Verrucomicrobiota bacterium]
MSKNARRRSDEFLRISDQFKLGALVTESSHPVTASLSEVAERDIAEALDLLFQVDEDVVRTFAGFVESGRAKAIRDTVLGALRNGGRLFFTGCGSTGRLSILLVSMWREFWQRASIQQRVGSQAAADWEQRAFSVMAGGDFALIKSVEGFEDFAAFGRKQLGDLGVSARDVVFAITEGGETSFVIGTAWRGVEAGARVYFVYNNPDDILRARAQRSREVIDDPRIEKINLTTGPMAITGSTRMQATTIQLCVLSAVLEMVVRELIDARGANTDTVPEQYLSSLKELQATLRSSTVREALARLVALEESAYRRNQRNNYYASALGIDVLTDTTERSPTYCTPPFRKFDDAAAAESWAFLFVPQAGTAAAWEHILRRPPGCIEWSPDEVRQLVGEAKAPAALETVRKIGCEQLLRFRIGMDGLEARRLGRGDSAVGIVLEGEEALWLEKDGFIRSQLSSAKESGAETGLVGFGSPQFLRKVETAHKDGLPGVWVPVPMPQSGLLLDGVTRAGVKMVLNALSTCTMVRLGRVMGNYMIWVVASNLKLIDRATRYIERLTGLSYDEANRRLFEAVEYVEPRMKSDRAYPPVVGLAVLRARHGISFEEAERRLMSSA